MQCGEYAYGSGAYQSAAYKRKALGVIFFFSPFAESGTAAAISKKAATLKNVILSPRKHIPNTAGSAMPPIIIATV